MGFLVHQGQWGASAWAGGLRALNCCTREAECFTSGLRLAFSISLIAVPLCFLGLSELSFQ